MRNHLLVLRQEDAPFDTMEPDELQAVLDKFTDWNRTLRDRHQLVSAGKLSDDLGTTLRSRGGDLVLDGPFSEAKEAIAGFQASAGDMIGSIVVIWHLSVVQENSDRHIVSYIREAFQEKDSGVALAGLVRPYGTLRSDRLSLVRGPCPTQDRGGTTAVSAPPTARTATAPRRSSRCRSTRALSRVRSDRAVVVPRRSAAAVPTACADIGRLGLDRSADFAPTAPPLCSTSPLKRVGRASRVAQALGGARRPALDDAPRDSPSQPGARGTPLPMSTAPSARSRSCCPSFHSRGSGPRGWRVSLRNSGSTKRERQNEQRRDPARRKHADRARIPMQFRRRGGASASSPPTVAKSLRPGSHSRTGRWSRRWLRLSAGRACLMMASTPP